jgi:hypothetical protein
MQKYISFCAALVFQSCVFAAHIDVFGGSDHLSRRIIHDFGLRLEKLERERTLLASHHQESQLIFKEINEIKQQIKHKYHLPDLIIDSVFYPERNDVYTTLNICPKAVNAYPKQTYPVKKNMDIVDRMHFFIIKAVNFMVQHPEYTHRLNCLDDHCITPEHPYFKKDLSFFRLQVSKQWSKIQHTMFFDPVFERRRAAIFLIPYLKQADSEAIILSKLLGDDSAFIRHDALRVYGELAAKHPNIKVSIPLICQSLNSCDEAERNKALILLNELAKQKQYHAAIIKSGGLNLLKLLQLYQPNNHDFAYQILIKISQKKIPERNFKLWQEWLNQKLAVKKI